MHYRPGSLDGAGHLISQTAVLSETIAGIWSVTTFVTGGDWKENCYLLRHLPTGEQALIDPGADDGQIAERVQTAGGPLRHILLTHAHHDHVGAAAASARRFDVALPSSSE